MQLTEEQLEQYKTEGYTVVRGLISPDEGCRVRNRLMDLLTGEHDWPDTHFQVLDPSKFRNSEDVSFRLVYNVLPCGKGFSKR